MSARVVRMKAKHVPTAARRPLALDVAVRLPPVARAFIAGLVRLPHGRLRRALVEFATREGVTGSLNRRDYDFMRFGATPDVELVPSPEVAAVQPGDQAHAGSIVRGPEAVVGFVREWLEGWGQFTFVLEEVIDLGDGGFLALHRMRAQGASSGIEIGGQEEAEHWHIREGLVARIQQWWSWEEALSALGVHE
jgi:hypothetical protein